MSNPVVLLRRGALLSQLQLCRWRNPGNRLLSSMSRSDIARLSDEESTRKALEAAAREDRLDFQTAARILMSSSQDERKFGYDIECLTNGVSEIKVAFTPALLASSLISTSIMEFLETWDFHLVQLFFACLPPLAVYGVAQYSRYDQRKMEKERDAKVQKIIEAEFEIELGVELEEVAAILNSSNPELKELKLRLEAMEERILKLEPALQQSRKAPQNSVEPLIISPEGGKQPAALQEVNKEKLASKDGGESPSNETKAGEGAQPQPSWIAKIRAISGDWIGTRKPHKDRDEQHAQN